MKQTKRTITVIMFFVMLLVVPSVLAAPNRPTEMGRGQGAQGPKTTKALLHSKAAISTGTVTVISGTTLTISKDGKTYTVLTDDKTQFRRRFWGKSSLSEISVNDSVNVIGRWTDDAKTTIQAVLVRDVSIQRFNGVFFGTVQSVTGTGWVMGTVERGNQTVTVSSATTFTDRKGKAITKSDIAVGHRVRVRGMWDRKAGTITQVTAVKDFTIPVVANTTPKVTATATPTPTPTPTPTKTPTPTPTP